MTEIYSLEITELTPGNRTLWKTIRDEGENLVFGDRSEKKNAKYVYYTVGFSGSALVALNKGEMPDDWLFHGKMVTGYIAQFDDPVAWKNHEYAYADRLLNYEAPNVDYPKSILSFLGYLVRHLKMPSPTIKINQLKHMREQLKESLETGIQSTRIVAITSQPHLDYGKNDIPCLREARVFPVGGKEVEIHYVFRSHDYGNGIMANMAYLNNGILNHVIKPCGCVLKKVIVTSQIAHLYNSDSDMVEKAIC